ncbi:MAG: hypothetical protein ACKVP1_10200, partial [Burkholderiaceae bacterium]
IKTGDLTGRFSASSVTGDLTSRCSAFPIVISIPEKYQMALSARSGGSLLRFGARKQPLC